MTFTDADHAKAVELYERYKGAEWWPRAGGTLTPCKATTSGWCWAGASGCYKAIWEPIEAMSPIAWAMVERFGTVEIERHDRHGWRVVLYSEWQPTRFLALAAAVEAMDVTTDKGN